MGIMSREQWLQSRKAEALKIDPDTAEVSWIYGDKNDPYCLCRIRADDHQHVIDLGAIWFAKSPDSDVWVWNRNLPAEVFDKIGQRIAGQIIRMMPEHIDPFYPGSKKLAIEK